MGSGADYTRKVARQEALKSLQNYFAREANKSCCCQLAKLDGSKTKGTLASGQVVDIQPIGIPGQYCMTCPLHNSKRAAIKPEPIQIHVDSTSTKCWLAGRGTFNYSGQTVADTRSGFTLNQLQTSPYYLRLIGRNSSLDAEKYYIPINLLNPKLEPESIQIHLSSDGKAVLIGGFYQDHPPFSEFSDQPSGGSGGCQGNCEPVAGYDYHTHASWAIYFNITKGDADGDFINFEESTSGTKDLTVECFNKITAPQTENLGSANVFRLFPTLSDVLGIGQGSGETIGEGGYALDIQGNPVDARFFPNAFDTYTWSGAPFSFNDGFSQEDVLQVGGEGSFTTSWVNDAQNNALFINNRRVSLAITDSNLVYAFNVNTTGNTYTVDIVGDISYATIYYVSQNETVIDGTFHLHFTANSGLGTTDFQCGYSEHDLYVFNYTYPSLYPYLSVFYNSFNDVNIIFNSTTENLMYEPYGPQIRQLVGEGTVVATQIVGSDLITTTTSGTVTSYIKSCGIDPTGVTTNELSDWVNITVDNRVCAACDLSNSFSEIFFYVTNDVHTITNWDGSGITIIDDPNTPIGLDCFIPHIGAVSGQCSGLSGTYGCCSQFFYGHTVDNSFQNHQNISGFMDGYRYGRGMASFESVSISTYSDNVGWQHTNNYIGPSIQISRLSSHSNQNHTLRAFRSREGAKAVVYQCADPFTIADAQGGSVIDLTQYQDDFLAGLRGEENAFFDALFNGENVLAATDSNRFNTSNRETRPSNNGFSKYYWSSPYVTDGTNIAPDSSALPPDVFTDKVLSPFGTFPLFTSGGSTFVIDTRPPADWNLLDVETEPSTPAHTTMNLGFPCNQMRGVDSYIVNSITRRANSNNVITNMVASYSIAEDGEVTFGKVIQDNAGISASQEKILDYLISI